MKTCSGCGQCRPAGDFHRRADSPDGLRSQCRECRHKAYLKDAEAQKARSMKSYLANPERTVWANAIYREFNRLRRLEMEAEAKGARDGA